MDACRISQPKVPIECHEGIEVALRMLQAQAKDPGAMHKGHGLGMNKLMEISEAGR